MTIVLTIILGIRWLLPHYFQIKQLHWLLITYPIHTIGQHTALTSPKTRNSGSSRSTFVAFLSTNHRSRRREFSKSASHRHNPLSFMLNLDSGSRFRSAGRFCAVLLLPGQMYTNSSKLSPVKTTVKPENLEFPFEASRD